MITARELAATTLGEILDEGGYNNIVLNKNLNKYDKISPADRAMVTELVNGTLRNLILIDHIIAAHSKTPVKKAFIKSVLRISVYQIMFMDKVPDRAVCDEAVKMAKAKGLVGLSGYVNGVLRNVVRSKDSVELPNKSKDLVHHLSVKYSHPKWIVEYFLSFMDAESVERVCDGGNAVPSMMVCANNVKTSVDELKKTLAIEGVEVYGTDVANALKIKGSGDVRSLQSFKSGLYHAMDINAMKAIDLIKPKPKDRVLDLCASPGGKSFYAAQLMKNEGEVLSLDIHEHKIGLIKDGAKRLGLNIIRAGQNDAAIFNPAYESKWDKVILDAPCSGLGVLSKKPDARYKKSMDDIKELASIQRKMMEVSAKYPKVGGKLLYSTCTISVLENDDNVKWFLEKFPYEVQSELRTLPSVEFEGDGFYAVCLVRKE